MGLSPKCVPGSQHCHDEEKNDMKPFNIPGGKNITNTIQDDYYSGPRHDKFEKKSVERKVEVT